MSPPCFRRYVAIGDSSTEGLEDPDGRGGYRGWANRLAGHVDAVHGELLYANLAIRGLRTRRIRDEQLAPALAMQPDLATVFAGTNDAVSRRFDPAHFRGDLEAILAPLVATGATVLTFTMPDVSRVMPLGRLLAGRLRDLNVAIRAAAAATGARVVDFEAHPVAGDPRLWHADRLHANALGHARIAAALAHALELPGWDARWSDPIPDPPPHGLVAWTRAEAAWIGGYLIPWLWRHARGRSSGDGRRAKRPELAPFAAEPR